MEQIICKNLSFSYPLSDSNTLESINFSIKKGEFVVLCGKSGCGKTTLLRHLKKELTPAGKRSGEVIFNGTEISTLGDRDAASKIGFVMQNPESQIVTDKVWHELAFGLENLGEDTASIRLKTAEMATYFGMQDMFDQKISELSGGKKQMLNLASVMVMNPEIIIFDEPTSQLDPIAAGNFLSAVSKINRELGITVVMTEHRLEEVFGCADRVIVMDSGRITIDCPPDELSEKISGTDEFVKLAMPASIRIHSQLSKGKSPLTVNSGAKWLSSLFEGKKPGITRIEPKEFEIKSNAIEIKNVFFRYEKNGTDIIKNLSLDVPEGSIFAVMGGNAAGKSTLLKILSGALKPVSGKIKIFGENIKKSGASVVAMPQSVEALFTRKTVREELAEMKATAEKTEEVIRLTRIAGLLDRHPYDVSGGEMQRVALAKLLLKDPGILLLDEPTKGMDAEFKTVFAEILYKLKSKGKTVVMVSHDIEFCSVCADFCAMIFDGAAACVRDSNSFFAGNKFYTTSANRMSRHIFENCVTDKDVIELCRKNLK